MIALDTDVLAVYHVFHSDRRYETTKRFFTKHFQEKTPLKILTPSEFLESA